MHVGVIFHLIFAVQLENKFIYNYLNILTTKHQLVQPDDLLE